MRQTTGLGLLAIVLAAVSMGTFQAGQNASSPILLGHPLHLDALGAPKPDAPLARRPARGVKVRIDRGGFEVAGPKTLVSLSALDTGRAGWARFARGASRRTSFGRETIVVAPDKTEQFLTVDRAQGKRTWRWRLASPGIAPRVGADGAISFVRGHRLAPVHIAPVQILDAKGADVTPSGLRWSLRHTRKAWSLELRLDDSRLPTPYLIDPAITLRSAAAFADNNGGAASLTIYKPIGVVVNDFLLAGIQVRGIRTITPPAGWLQVRRDQQGSNLTQAIYYKVAGANEPGSYEFTFSASDKATGGILPYVGVDNSNPIDASSGNPSSSNSANVTALSVNTSAANHVVAGFFGINRGATFTPPGGMTEEWDTQTTGGGSVASEAADYTAPAGATGNKTAVASSSQAWIGQLVALKLDTAAPTQSLSVTEGARPDLQYFNSGTGTVYYNPAAAGDFTVNSTITDAGATQVTFPAISATGFTHTAAYRTQVLADEPLAYWRLGESSGTSAADASGNANTGTYAGSPALGATGALAGNSDTAVSFDGVDDNVSVAHNAVLNLNGSFSLEFWAKQTAFANTSPGIINKGTSSTADGYLIWANSSGTLGFKRNNVNAASAAGALTSSYKHFVVTYDGVTLRWYVNGALSTSTALSYPSNASSAALTLGLGDAGQYGKNVLDDVAVYQTALSATRIAEHYNVGTSVSRDEVDTQSPFASATYSFDQTNTTAPGAQTITGLDGAGSSVTTTLTFVRDVSPPTAMSASVTAGYYTSLSVPVALSNGNDPESGLDSTTGIVERDEVGLSADSCGAFPGSWAAVTLSGGNDTTVVSGKCYRYRYKISDRVANQGTQAGASATAKIDTSAPAPAPSLSYGSFSNAALASGVVYYRPGAASGQFAVTASGSSDPESGIASYGFPAAAGGWSRSVVGATATYSHTGGPTDPADPNDVIAQNNAGLGSAATSFTVTPDGTPPASAVQCDGAACSAGWYSSSVSVSLSATDSASGLDLIRYTTDGSDPSPTNGATYSAPFGVSSTTTVRFRAYDRVGNEEAVGSRLVQVDTSAPGSPGLTLTESPADPEQHVAGATLYYNPQGSNAGSFSVDAATSDPESGIEKVTFPAVTGMSGGGDDPASPYQGAYSWTASTSASGAQTVTARNNAGLTSTATFTVTPDTAAPSGGSIDYADGLDDDGLIPITTADGSDSGAGVNPASGLIERQTSIFDGVTCGGFGGWSGPIASPDTLAAGTCAKYRYSVSDNVGNAVTYTSPNIAKTSPADSTPPSAPVLSFSAFTNASATGSTVYFRPGAAGGFSVTGTSSDPESAISYLTFPALGSDWAGGGADASPPYEGVYTFTATAVDPAEPNKVTATNGVDLTSSPTSFTVTSDATPPASAIQCDGAACSGGWYSGTVSVSLSASDPASGVDLIRFTTDGSDPSPLNGTTYSAPFSVAVTATVRFRAYDLVGNEEAVGSQLVRIDTTGPAAPALTLAESPASLNQHVSGTMLYYNPSGSNSGSFSVDAATSDPESGIEKVTFPALTGMAGGGDDTTSPYDSVYSWTSSTGASGSQTVTARNNAGLQASASFTVTPDSTAPTGQTAALVGGPYYTTASVGFTTGDGTDSSAGLDTSSRLVERASAQLTDGTCGGFGGFGGSHSSPDTSVVSGNCYRYRFTIADNVGNVSTSVVTADAKVDTSPPTATMGDPGANLRGTISLTSATGDPESGVATITYERSPAGLNTWTATAATWNTTLVADGLYDLRVVVTNSAGVTTTSGVVSNRRVDNTAPSATTDDPGSPISGTVTLTATAGDGGSGLDTGTFQYSASGTGPWTTIATDPSSPFSADWDTTAVSDGRYSLRVIVTDLAGNSTTSAALANRQVQNNPPFVNITSPGSYLNAASPSPLTITANVTGNVVSVAQVEFFRCDNASVNCSTGSFVSLGIDTTDPYSASWAQASEPEGNRTLKAIVTDQNNSTGLDMLNVTIDRTAPSGSITGPAAGAFVAATVSVSSNSADSLSGVAQVVFERSPAGVGSWTAIGTDTSSPYSTSWDTTSLSDGAYDLRAVTTDLAGNSFTSGILTVTVDNTGPTATQDDPGANLRATVTLTGSAADTGGSGVAQVVFMRSPAGANSWTTIDVDSSAPYAASFDTTGVSDGLYDLRVVATDNVGNVTTSAPIASRRVDNTVPTVSQDDPGTNLRASVTLTGSAADTGGSGVAQVVFERSPAGAGSWTAIGTDASAPYSTSFDTTGVSDGLYDLRVVATDNAGNVTSSATVANRRVDNTPPSATMNDPGANLSGTVALWSTTSDGGSGIDTVTYQYSPAGQNTWTTTPSSWNTTLVGDGLYDLRVIATDNAGNSTTSTPVVNRRVDNGVPDVSITSPTVYVNGSDPDPFTVTASSPDTDLSGIEFFACDNTSTGCSSGNWVSLGVDASTPYSVSWTLPGADGNRALRAVATDLAANTGQAVHDVLIDRAPPSGGSVSYLDGYDSTGSITITSSNGSDSGSGIDPGSAVIERDSASLSGGGCGSFPDTWTNVTSPDTVASGNCYRYLYRISDFAGNTATYTSGNVARVDTSAPSAPSFSFSAFTNAAASGQTVYFLAGSAGGFTVTASSSDTESGIASYAFPALGIGWSGSQFGASFDYSFGAGAADPAEPNNATAQNNAGLSSSPSSFTVTPDGSAPASSIACDGSSCSAGWYTSSVSVSLSASDGGSGLAEIRYTTDGSDPSPLNGTTYSAPFSVVVTATVRFRAYDRVGNEEAVGSELVRIDTTGPAAPALTLAESPASPNQHVSGTTLYYNPQGGNTGSFTVDAATGDPESGIEKVTFPALTGMAGGGDDFASPYQGSYSWGASSSAVGAQSVTARNNAGLQSSTGFTVTPDTAAPSAGSVDYPDGYVGGSVTITTDDGSDALSGVDSTSGVIERDSATLAAGSCSAFADSWSAVVSPDSTLVSGHCYRYRYRVSDNVGNAAVYASAAVAKFSATPPSAPDLSLAETPASPNQHVSGTTLYYNPGGSNSGTFTVVADTSDSESGTERVDFPAVTDMTGGGDDFTSPYESVYGWTAATGASGAQTVRAYNNAGLSAASNFTVTPDTAPPAGQGVDTDNGPYYTTLSVPLTLLDGSDAGAGVDASSGVVQRESATLSNDNCVSWSGSWADVTLVGGADTSVAPDRCYRYRYFVSDNVGNQSAPSPDSSIAKVDVDAPATADDAPAGWSNTAVTVTLTPTDSGSGVASTEYRVDGGAVQNGTSVVISAPADHSNDGAHTIAYRSTDAADNVEALRSATVRIDTTLPVTTDDAPAGWSASAVTVTLTAGDALSGVASTEHRVDGGAFQSGTSILVAAPADHSNDGVHTIEYRSTDNAGNAEPLRTAAVRIDTQLPSGALTAPADGAHVNGSVAISAAAGDLPSGVASVEFLVRPNGSGSFSTISTDTTAPYDAGWDSTGEPEGNAELKVVVVDGAGQSFTSAVRTVVVDNPPAPTLNDPGANLAGTVTLAAASQPDTAQVIFERSPAGAGSWTPIATDATAPFSADFDSSAVGDGNYDFRAIATDLGGFNGTSPLRTSRVDNTAPSVSVSDPADGATVSGPSVRVAALASDLGSGVSSVRFEQRPAGSGSFTAIGTDTSAPYEASWDTTSLSGSYELRAVATDAAGNPATAPTVTVAVDATAASVSLDDPGSLLRGVVDLSATAPNLSIASVAFEGRPAAGGSWTRIALDTSRPWGAAFDTKTIGDGLYDLRAQALNGSGDVLATHTRQSIRIDNTAPRLESATPAEGADLQSATSIVLTASEPVADVRGATLDDSAATGEISGASVTFSTGPLGAGQHSLTGTFVDAAGNTGAFALHFTIRAEAKAAFVVQVGKPKAPLQGKQRVFLVPVSLSAPATVRATLLSPTGRKLRTIRTKLPAGRHSLRFALPTDALPPGRYTILVVATSSLDGTRATSRVTVTISATRKHKQAVEEERKKEVLVSVDETAPPTHRASADRAPAPKPAPKAHPSGHKPTPEIQSPKRKPLEIAGSYAGSKPGRSIGLGVALLVLGAGLAFLIKLEIGRLLATRRPG